MMTTRIVLASDEAFEARLRAAMPELNGNLHRWSGSTLDLQTKGVGELIAASPEVVAFGPGYTTDAVLAVAGELDRLHPELEVMVVADPSPTLWERVARAGVRELIPPTADDEELASAMRRAVAHVESRRGAAVPTAPAGTAAIDPKVIVVRSPKGGSGKTMVATNVAFTLAKAHPGEVALLDLDLQFGDVATALGIQPEYTIADAAANEELTPTGLKALLATHGQNLYVLCAPTEPTQADDITSDDILALIDLLRSAFRHVVVDTSGGLDEHTLAALDAATDVVLVCSNDVSSVRALRKEVDALTTAGIAAPRRHVVLNRANSRVGLEERDIAAAIGSPVNVRLESSRSVPLNMNCGIPVVEAEPAAAVSKQLCDLAARLVPVQAAPTTRWWRRRR